MNKTPGFKILDCTIRDGGYVTNWRFDKTLVREVYRALSKSGLDYVEIGYRGTERHFDPERFGAWRFSTEEDVRDVVSNINGARIALMADYGRIEPEDFREAADSVVDMVRVAVHRDKLMGAARLVEAIKARGYEVALNAMGYTGYSEGERRLLVDLLKGSGVDYVYVADSYGALFPGQIRGVLEPLLEAPGVKVGFHPHNSLQMAFANTIEAINCGVHIIDSTIYGMGRAAGNLPTEIIITYLEDQRGDKNNSIPILNLIDKYFLPLHDEHRWGYQLPYMLSGMFQCHPDYARHLIEYKEYTVEDMWKTMDYVRRKNPAGFSKELLTEVINEGIIGHAGAPRGEYVVAGPMPRAGAVEAAPRQVPYRDRHRGRDFLILANGPTLRTHRGKIERFIERFDPVILGANFLGGLFVPHYHAFNNKRRFTSYADTVADASRLLVGPNIPEETVREYTDRDFERLHYVDVLDAAFDIKDGVITTNCRTVSVLLLGVAIVMGAKRIFAAGMDGYAGASNHHFYRERDEKEDPALIVERHRWCQRFLEEIDGYLDSRGREGIHILTPTSYKSFYKGIDNYLQEEGSFGKVRGAQGDIQGEDLL